MRLFCWPALLLFLSIGELHAEDEWGPNDPLYKAINSVMDACFMRSMSALLEMKGNLGEAANSEESQAFLKNYSNTLLKMCLDVSAFKLKEAADAVEVSKQE